MLSTVMKGLTSVSQEVAEVFQASIYGIVFHHLGTGMHYTCILHPVFQAVGAAILSSTRPDSE